MNRPCCGSSLQAYFESSGEFRCHFGELILHVWEAPGKHFDCLGCSWETFCLIVGLPGDMLAVWEAHGNHFVCLGGYCNTFCLSWKLLGHILTVWEAPGKQVAAL